MNPVFKAVESEFIRIHCVSLLFQEIETDQFFNFFLPELQRHGYNGIFSPKSRARTMTEEDRKYVDGCAIFYRTSKYVIHLISALVQIYLFLENVCSYFFCVT